jgi:hypothetical protein
LLFHHWKNKIIPDCVINPEVVLKVHHLPPDKSGVLLLSEEEKVNALLIFTFPSFAKEGCPDQSVGTGWLKYY